MTGTPLKHYCGRCGAELKTMGCPNGCYSLRADAQEEAVQKVRDGKVTPNIEWIHRNQASILFARIDSLEAERDLWRAEWEQISETARKLLAQRDAAQAENARLREALAEMIRERDEWIKAARYEKDHGWNMQRGLNAMTIKRDAAEAENAKLRKYLDEALAQRDALRFPGGQRWRHHD